MFKLLISLIVPSWVKEQMVKLGFVSEYSWRQSNQLSHVVILFWMRMAVNYQKPVSSDLVVDNINASPNH